MRNLVSAWLDDAVRDILHAARLFRRNPLFALTTGLSLAIGIGANTTVFTIADALLLRPPAGVVSPAQLVDIGVSRRGGGFNPASYPNYQDLRERATTLDSVYAYSMMTDPLSLGTARAGEELERINGSFVTMNFFTALGAHPAAGRLFGRADSEQPDASPFVVISHRFWQGRFHGDPTIVGQQLRINGAFFAVIGVASDGFQGTGIRATDVWLPVGELQAATARGSGMLSNRAAGWLAVGARLRPGVSVAQAAAEVKTIGQALEREYPDQNRARGFRLTKLSAVGGDQSTVTLFIALLMSMVTTVLIITCANVAGALLARATARQHEIAVRLAIGAGRSRLVRQLLAETMLLFLIGGAVGLVVARALTSVLVSLLPTLPFRVDVALTLDARVIAFTAGLALVAAILSGLVPALPASKADVVSALKDNAQAPGGGRLRQIFVIAQVAFSILLVVIAALFVHALQRAGSMDPGFVPHGVELASIDLSVAGYTEATGPFFGRNVVARVRSLPGVQSASLAAVLPGGFEGIGLGGLTIPGAPPPLGDVPFEVTWNVMEPGYFETLRMPLVAGRDFSADDRAGTMPVAIVGEAAARRFWPGQDAIGKYIERRDFGPPSPGRPATRIQIVGVARDPRYGSLVDNTTGLHVYLPFQQQYRSTMMIVARSTRGQRLTNDIRGAVGALNPNLPVTTSQTAEDYTGLALVPERIAVSVSGSLGLIGLLLAAIGIYGVTAYMVARRTREIGIRVALGARNGDIVSMVLRQGMSLTLIGLVIGLALAAAASHLLTGMLFGVQPLDPPAFLGAAALFATVGLAACYAPTRRAVGIDPLKALRQQ